MKVPPPRSPKLKRPVPPKHLAAPERKLWQRIVAENTFVDAAGLELLATALESRQRLRLCREAIARDGQVVKDRFGQLRGHPLLAAERDARSGFVVAMKALALDVNPEQDDG
jgi:hypothetical protein